MSNPLRSILTYCSLLLKLSLLLALVTGFSAVASITSTSGNIMYVDSSSNQQPNLLGNYVSFNVTNDTGSAIADAWVNVGNFTGSFVSLAPNETGVAHLGPLAAGATLPVFFYLQVDCSSFSAGQCNISTAQGFTVRLYSGQPSTNLVDTQAFSVTAQETIAAQANKVTTVVTSSNSPILGSLITVTVTGATGTIGNSKTFYASPQTYVTFPANSFRLYSTSVTFSGANTGTYNNQLLVPTSAFSSTSSTNYSFVATYLVHGNTLTSTAVSPVAFISSGNQIKHTDTSGFATIPPIGPTSNTLTLSKLVNSAVWPTGGVPTYTLRLSNSGSSAATVDNFIDSLPTSPATVSYVAGSSSYAGTSIGDPAISGSTLTWTSTFSVPANGSADLTFQATVPNVAGLYTNSAIGQIGSAQIDSTLLTSDNSPATVSLSVGSPDLTISKSHAGSFSQGQTGATYSVTVSNVGSGPSVGTVTMTDTLPTGLTATAVSGTGWSCTLATLTCTRSDALAASSSYPVLTLTVNVAANAPASVTNTAAVSGGGETNTGNDSASDLTAITQLPDLTIAKSHSGSFTQGQTGATYSITVSNSGSGATSGTVTVTDTLPTGLTATAVSGTGWSCTLATLTCTRSDALAASSSYPALTLTVNVAANAPPSVTNTATVSGGGETNTGNDSASDVTAITQLPDLTIAKSHSGNFTQGQTGAAYSITVSNSGSGATSGTVTMTDTLPTGLTATAVSGTGWSCTLATLTCTRSDALAASSSYPALTLTVNVAANAPASVTNTATVSGGGETNTGNDSASDLTAITQLPDLTIAKSHSGSFTQGQTGAAYSITVSNSGSGATSGTVTVTDTLPTGLTATAVSGTGWSCTLATLTCTRSDALAASSSYPALTLTVNVAANAPASVTNTATVSGGGETNTGNDSASDVTAITTGAPKPTTTSLTIQPGSTVNAGTPVTLTATVLQASNPVFPGTVLFCDANATQCTGSALLGTVQLGNSGTAALTLTLGTGNYSIKATFTGTSSYQSSSSAPQSLTVSGTGGYVSKTEIAATGSASSYTLTGTVSAFGKPLPVGTVSFLDTTNGNAVVGSMALDPASLAFISTILPNSQAVDGTPSTAISGDFDNDGKLDLAIPQATANKISVLLGNGDGTFQPQVSYDADSNGEAYAAAVGDFNGDGNLDLAVTNIAGGGASSVSVLLGKGDGTFLPQVAYSVGNHPSAIATADFNGDGNADLVVANRDDNTVGILLGNGDGTFQTETTFAVGNSPVAVAVSDINGDGNVDIIAANNADNSVSVLLGNGDGTFQTQTAYAVGSSPLGILSIDLNADGNVDLAVANSNDNTIGVLLGNGDGTFQTQVSYGAVNFPGALVAADFNGDGKIDIASPASVDGQISILLGNGDGTLQTTITASAGTTPNGLSSGDFNGDGLTDLATVSSGSTSTVSILLSQHTETAIVNGVSFPGTGTHDVLASFPGDTNYAASQSPTVPLDGVGLTATTTTLTAVPNPAVAGQAVTLTATVSPTPTGTPLGTVSFYDGATLIGTVAVDSSGSAVFTTSSLPTGSNNLTAVYSGNSNFASSTSPGITEIVTTAGPTPTTTSLTSSPNPAVAGQSVTLTATVSPTPTGSPLGTVSFYDGTTLIGTASVDSSGVATLVTTSLPVGTVSLTAVYSGNSSFAGSTSSPVTETVTAIATSTVLTGSPNPAVFGQAVTLTATVSPTPTGSPLGTVSFYDGATLIGTGSLNASGIATLATNNLPVGTHTLTAVYSGNLDSAGSTSSPFTETVTTVPTTTVLAASPDPVLTGQTVTLTATVSPTPTGSPLGSVNFYNGATLIGTGNLNSSGIATLTTSSLPVGSNALTAVYSGNPDFAGSTSSPITETVTTTPTTTVLTASPNPALTGQTVTLTATVSPTPTGSPLGSVDFYNGATLIGTGNVNSSGVATFSTNALPVGTNTLTATYSGNAQFGGSTSAPVTETVNTTPTTTVLTASPNPVLAGQVVTLTATVSPTPSGTPLGTVNFYSGTTLIGTATVNSSGVATLSISSLPLGTDTLTATYSGNSIFAGSTSSPVTETVTTIPTTTVLTASPNPVLDGQTVTLTATVSPTPTGSPLGSVNFYDGATLIGTATVNSSGIATLTTNGLPVGTSTLTAAYSGNATFAASTSSPVTETVTGPTATTTVLSAAPNPAVVGQAVLLTATVSPTPTGAPLGSVSFYNGTTLIGSAVLNSSGIATLSTSSLPIGSNSLTAVYSGNSTFSGSTSSPVTETVTVTPTATVLSTNPNPSIVGQSVTLTATVSPTPTGSPLGTIIFYDGTTSIGSSSLNSAGTATLATTTLSSGSRSLTAVYSGNITFGGSTSSPVNQIVLTSTITTLAVSPNPSTVGQTVTFTATVSPAPTGSPLGSINFYSGTTLLGTGAVDSSGVAVMTISNLQAGTYSITAVYSGNALFAGSTSAAVPLTVNSDAAYTVTAPPNPFTVVAGGTVSIDIGVPPVGGPYNQPVTMSGSSFPPGSTWEFTPSAVTPGASGATSMLTVHTASQSASSRTSNPVQFPLGIGFAAGMVLLAGKRKQLGRALVMFLAFLTLAAGTLTLTSCGGGWPGPPGTQSHTYVITVTGTSGSLHPSATVTLIVK